VFNIGPMELMIIFILALLVVGPKKLPELSRQLGKGIREFRRVSDEVRGEIDGALNMDADDDDPPVDKPSTVAANGSGPDPAEGKTDSAPEAPSGDAPPTERSD
jgi:sec-independent protein translocase protein TatB